MIVETVGLLLLLLFIFAYVFRLESVLFSIFSCFVSFVLGFWVRWQNQNTCVQGLWFSVIFLTLLTLLPSEKKNRWMSVNLNRIDIKKIVRWWCLPFLLPFALACGPFLSFSRLTLVPMEMRLVRSFPLSCSSKFALTLCHFFSDFPLI